ncbi:MAG TPA: hypothetical protein PKE27_08460 [Povalibacter sp.]|uniref:hypothetical protein n=1 Tax=Povalibacter sp. TaxID=1962978 RepID=UPI002B783073|nr:hypothetical protein [Povalibacter sp.]HMN44589.1 hypothetical protein [Povalibacter sp.]
MRVAILLPETNCFPDLEQHVFDFTNRLGRYCASITSCSIAIEPAPAQSSRQPDFAVKLTLQVFGETLQLMARAPAQASDDALTRALEEIFHQALARLEPISQNHSGCGCGLGTEICAPSNCKGN